MTKKEFAELTKKWQEEFYNYHNYMEQFFTTYINGELVNKATKSYSLDEIKKIDELKLKLDELENKWLEVIKSQEKLID